MSQGLFKGLSGPSLNINKCKLVASKECSKSAIYNFPVKNEIWYLGVLITMDQQRRTDLQLG